MAINLFIIGPSGCGKSTQARMLAEKYGLTHISVGQLLRNEITENTPYGQKAKEYVDNGMWVPSTLVVDVVKEKLMSINYENFVIDGFPRLLDQGMMVESYLQEMGKPVTKIFHLDVTAQEIQERRKMLQSEGVEFSDAGRTDENPEAIAQRQKSYEETINPIIDYFTSKGIMVRINGNRPIEPIFEDINKVLDTILITS